MRHTCKHSSHACPTSLWLCSCKRRVFVPAASLPTLGVGTRSLCLFVHVLRRPRHVRAHTHLHKWQGDTHVQDNNPGEDSAHAGESCWMPGGLKDTSKSPKKFTENGVIPCLWMQSNLSTLSSPPLNPHKQHLIYIKSQLCGVKFLSSRDFKEIPSRFTLLWKYLVVWRACSSLSGVFLQASTPRRTTVRMEVSSPALTTYRWGGTLNVFDKYSRVQDL